MKQTVCMLLLGSLLAGCAAGNGPSSRQENVPFNEGQLYAAAYLGYQQPEGLDRYVDQYLDSDRLPVYYLSGGDYYLVIPRYAGTELELYHNDMETGASTLVCRDPDCGPFLLQCNVSDIFADATVRLTYEKETVEFSPFLSLKDGTPDIGPDGLDLTEAQEEPEL